MSLLHTRPSAAESSPYYFGYIRLVPDGDIIETLRLQLAEVQGLLRSVAAGAQPAAEAWSINQELAHMSDAERLLGFRALWFARGETAALPGMDPDLWMARIEPGGRTLPDLLAEFAQVRAASIALFAGLNAAAWEQRGDAGGHTMSVRAWVWSVAGHAQHHINNWRAQYQ
ncbi:MAG: DinB family protein [Kouleothrix sp.]|jgi:hypothetical protein